MSGWQLLPRPSKFLHGIASLKKFLTDFNSYIQFSIQYASIGTIPGFLVHIWLPIWTSILVLLYYDYTLTFSLEVEYIWNAKFRLSTILYIFCRYALVANVAYLLNMSNKLNIQVSALFQASGLAQLNPPIPSELLLCSDVASPLTRTP